MTIIWCMVPETRSATDIIFCHSEPFFALLPSYRPRKPKFWKNEKKKKNWRYYHFTNVYHKWQSYYVWLLRYGAWWPTEFFVILDHFLHFNPHPNNPTKNQNFEKLEKNAWINYHFTHVYHKWQSYDVWFLRYWVQWIEFFILDQLLAFYPLTTQKI